MCDLDTQKANFKKFQNNVETRYFWSSKVDRCKTTQTKLLVEIQDGRKVELMRFPGEFSFLLRIVRLSVSKRKRKNDRSNDYGRKDDRSVSENGN